MSEHTPESIVQIAPFVIAPLLLIGIAVLLKIAERYPTNRYQRFKTYMYKLFLRPVGRNAITIAGIHATVLSIFVAAL
jgi:hypothetical protein